MRIADLLGSAHGLVITRAEASHIHTVPDSYHYSGQAVDLPEMSPEMAKGIMRWAETLRSGYRTFAEQARIVARFFRGLRLFPEFKALDNMRWAWPDKRVRERPFDYEVDAGPQRGPEDRRLGEVRWFA